MTRRTSLLAMLLVGIANVTGAHSETLGISVIDEGGAGIYSRVYYEDGTQPRPFWNTNERGELQRPQPCGKTRTLKAHPFDTGTYFDSVEEPCAEKVTLRVVKRKTPKGIAINFRTVPFMLSDGSPAVMVLKSTLDATSLELNTANPGCQVKLLAGSHQEVFKVDGIRWVSVKQGATELSKVIAGAEQPDQQVVNLPFACATAGERLPTLQAGAADRIEKSFAKGAIMTNETLKNLGIGYTLQ
jgi:hypothetical protein